VKNYFLLLSLLITAAILAACGGDDSQPSSDSAPENNNGASSRPVELRPERPADLPTVRVDRVIDGDTIEVSGGRRVRLIGINTPEQGEYLYDEASAFTRDLLEGEEVGLEPGIEAVDQFDRELQYVWVGNVLANYEIIRAGFANRYNIAPNTQYDGFFQRAEGYSQADQIGIWQGSENTVTIALVRADADGRDEENLNGEFVRLLNAGDTEVNLSGFTLRDAGPNVYAFGDVILGSQQSITIYTGCGQDKQNELYWCAELPVWNNSGDTAFLNDAAGLYVDHREIAGP
jgi:endonuclease YncB( thermonuclease family)